MSPDNVDQTPINSPDCERSDPSPPSSPSDDDQDSMYAQETPTCPSQYNNWPGRCFIWDNLMTPHSRQRWNEPMRFPTRADVIPEPERQQMLAEEPHLLNPPRHSGQIRQPVILPDNVYGDHAPTDILCNDSDDVFSGPSRCQRPGPSMAQHTELGTSSDLTQKSDIMAKMVQEGGAELFNLLLKKLLGHHPASRQEKSPTSIMSVSGIIET